MASEYVITTLTDAGMEERTARVILERIRRSGLLEDLENLYGVIERAKEILEGIKDRDPTTYARLKARAEAAEMRFKELIEDVGRDPAFSKLVHLSFRVEIPLGVLVPYRNKIIEIRDIFEEIISESRRVGPLSRPLARFSEESISKLKDRLEKIREQISQLEDKGVPLDFIRADVRRIEDLLNRANETASVATIEVVRRSLDQVREDLNKINEILAKKERVISVLSKVKEVCRYMDELASSDVYEAFYEKLSSRISAIEKELKSKEDIDKLLDDIKRMENHVNTLLDLYPFMERGMSPFDALSLMEGGLDVLDAMKAVMADESLSKEDKAARCLDLMRGRITNVDEFMEIVTEARRLYPFWKSYIMNLLKANDYVVRVDDLVKIPKKWRGLIMRMISSEDKDIIMEGNLVIHKKAISGQVLEEELNHMYEEAVLLQEIFEKLSKLEAPVGDLLEDVRGVLAEIERIRSNVSESSFLEVYSIKREINEIKDYLKSIFARSTLEKSEEKADEGAE